MAFNPALAGIGVLGTSAIVGGGVAISGILNEDASVEEIIKARDNPELKIKSKEPSRGHVVFDDIDDKNDPKETYKGKYVANFLMNFNGVKSGGRGSDEIDGGGKGTYKEVYRRDASEGFSITIITDGQQLRSACEKAYKGTLQENTGLITSEDKSTKFKESEVGEFCSEKRHKPVTIDSEGGYDNGTIGDGNNKSKLASTKDDKNFSFGRSRTFNIFRNMQKEMPDTYKFFKKRYQEEKDNRQGKNSKPKTTDLFAAKKGCEEAYNKIAANDSSDSQPTEDEVLQYCSIEDKYQELSDIFKRTSSK